MKMSIRYALLACAVIAAGIGVTGAAMQSRPQTGQTNAGQASQQTQSYRRPIRRGTARFLSQYDVNRDGMVTKDEFNKVTLQRFSEATGGGKAMNAQQLTAFRTRSLYRHADRAFRRADWNGDGRLSLDEYASPIRASFERADRQSTGVILCQANAAAKSGPGVRQRRRVGRGSPRGAANFCARDDLNRDGKVTRAELDKALAQQFAAATRGGNTLTREQFTQMQSARANRTSGRMFQRLDRDHSGTLTLEEFAAAQKRTFARLDRNNDGTITKDELSSSRRSSSGRGAQGRT